MLYIKAIVASMAGAWCIHWPVCDLYGPGKSYANRVINLNRTNFDTNPNQNPGTLLTLLTNHSSRMKKHSF